MGSNPVPVPRSTPSPARKENDMGFKREERYIVFKLSDVERYLTDKDRANIAMMKMEIDAGRDCANKPPFKGLIVEADWPEYEPTWRAIEARVTGAQAHPAPSVPDGWKLVPIEPTQEMINHVIDGRLDALCAEVNVWRRQAEAYWAKIEQMERQEPVGKFIRHPSNGLWEQDGYGDNPDARPLYALPGAQTQGEEK